MRAKVTVVVDNCVPINAGKPFVGEHGLSMLVEAGGKRILVDTGQSAAVVHNLGLLGISPASLDMIVLSHGHYDHAGGLMHLLPHIGKRVPVFAHEAVFKSRYSVSKGERRFVGIPCPQERLTALGADWRMIREPLELLPELWLSGAVPRITNYETGDVNLVLHDETSGCDCQDTIEDDMALFCRGSRGLVAISGCTHSGLVNMVRHGLAMAGCERLQGWIGGTHLGPACELQQASTVSQLADFQPEWVAANHCTGFRMMASLYQTFGDRFVPAFVGTEIVFD